MLDLGSATVDLEDYNTTGLRVVAIGPSGVGKTNASLLIAEQLAVQGWQVLLFDPEGELAELYPEKVLDRPEALAGHLDRREPPAIAVAPVRNAAAFIPWGEWVLDSIDRVRKPVFVVLDEGQLFSTSRRVRKDKIAEASAIVNDRVERGRKRALDLCLSAHRFSGTLHRSVFGNKNLTLVGRQEDSTAWASIAPMFRGTGIGYAELAGLQNGEFFVFSRRGVEKLALPMAAALAAVAPKATAVRPVRPATFRQWDQAVRELPTESLRALTVPVIGLLSAIVGLTSQQVAAGMGALRDELGGRA
jgi:DNA helicase HerA-like ATPase